MAPPCSQALLSILHHHHFALAVAASISMLVVTVGAAEAEPPPFGSGGYTSMPLIRRQSVRATLRYDQDEYLMEFKMGGSLVSGIIDTGSVLTWTNNSQLVDSAIACDDSKSTEENEQCTRCCCGNCMFNRKYLDGSVARGVMVNATLTMGSETTRGLVIGSATAPLGCSSTTSPKKNCELYGSGGIVGLGPGSQSLVKQLHLRGFSYCLSRDRSSQIVFYLPAEAGQQPLPPPAAAEGWKSTPLQVDRKQGRYYVELEKISVGGKVLDIPGGKKDMIIDSGATYTRLPKGVLEMVTEVVKNRMKPNLPTPTDNNPDNNDDLCFSANDADGRIKGMPDMELHFASGDTMVLPVGNYMSTGTTSNDVCLAMKATRGGKLANTFILGNFQQQNIDMRFDDLTTTKPKLWFRPRKCGPNMHAAA